MCCCFVRLVEGVGLGELLLVVCEALHLCFVQDAELGFLFSHFNFFGLGSWEVVVVFELGEGLFAAKAPCQVVVMGDEAHVVCVDGAEGDEAVSHDGEEGNEDIVNYVHDVVFSTTDVDPACCEGGWYLLMCWVR